MIDYDLLQLFRPADKVMEKLNRADFANVRHYRDWYCADYEEKYFARLALRCSAKVAKDRLDLIGVTLEAAEARFEEALRIKMEYDRTQTRTRETTSLSLDLDLWLDHFRRLWNIHCSHSTVADPLPEHECPLSDYECSPFRYYGFPGLTTDVDNTNRLHLLRLVMEQVPPDAYLSYELGDMIEHNYDADRFDEDIAALVHHIDGHLQYGLTKTTVITEGISDKECLERSLGILHPHLVDYYHFFEFEMGGIEGGAAQLAKVVKAFAAAGVQRPVVAFFDNDTAGRDAHESLKTFPMPDNIAVRRYPDLELARNYPALHTNGTIQKMNVNGYAGSIEIYFGEDILAHTCQLEPVEWKPYTGNVKGKQGVLRNKGKLQKAFKKKLKAGERNPHAIRPHEWQDMDGILDTLRTAFHSVGGPETLT